MNYDYTLLYYNYKAFYINCRWYTLNANCLNQGNIEESITDNISLVYNW